MPTQRLLPLPPIEQIQFSPISTVSSRRNGHFILPKLNLQKFNGDVTSYFLFWEGFRDATHTNSEIPPSIKFSYLKSYLDGQAARAIEGLPVTEGNYQSAVVILHDCFGRINPVILSRVPNEMALLIARHKQSDSWSISEV